MEYKKQRRGKRSPYSDSFRRMVVEEVLSGSIYIAGAAKKYGIAHRSTVSSWIKWHQNNADIELPKSPLMSENETDRPLTLAEKRISASVSTKRDLRSVLRYVSNAASQRIQNYQ